MVINAKRFHRVLHVHRLVGGVRKMLIKGKTVDDSRIDGPRQRPLSRFERLTN